MNQSLKVRRLVEAAMIAAIYTVLTYAAAALNLAYQGVQFRFSEALTILPVFYPLGYSWSRHRLFFIQSRQPNGDH